MQVEIVNEWIEKADEDFGFASISIEHTTYFGQICFHFQQAAEKYLKAFIIVNELKFRPIHNLLELLEICKEKEPLIEELRETCKYLNPFYVDTRYPVHWPTDYNKETAIKAKDYMTIELTHQYICKFFLFAGLCKLTYNNMKKHVTCCYINNY